jgi:hypothetical protein
MLYNFFIKDWLRKLTALFFAILIWYVVSLQLHEYETFREIPVLVQVQPPYTVVNKGTQFVKVKLRGPESRLKEISSSDINIEIDLLNPVGIGADRIPVSDEYINIPHGVSVDQVIPSHVSVRLDQIESKEVPVRVVTSGKLADTLHEIEEDRTVIPQKVTVSGPSRVLADIEGVHTETEYFDSKIIGSYEKTVKISKQLPLVSVSPSQVSVAFKVNEVNGEEVLRNMPIALLNADKERELKTTRTITTLDQLTLIGPKNDLKNITVDKVKAFIDLSEIDEVGTHKLPVRVWVENSDLKVIFVSPSTIDVEAEKKVVKTEEDKTLIPDINVDLRLEEVEQENKSLLEE